MVLPKSSMIGCDVDVSPWLEMVRGDLRRVLLLLLLKLLVQLLLCEPVCVSADLKMVNVCVCGSDGCD